MAVLITHTREEYVKQVKAVGQHIIDNADDIVGDIHRIMNIHIATDINRTDVSAVKVTKSTYVSMESENE